MKIDNTKLRFGNYRSPPFRYGERVDCLARGEVTIWGQSDGRIPWPIGKKVSALSLVLFGDLAKAVRREAAVAVRYWWGVGNRTVWIWRRALGVTQTEGDRNLRQEYMTPKHNRRMTAAATAVADAPERRQKIAKSRRGKPCPPEVIAKLRKANKGKKMSHAVRTKMSEVHKLRGTHPPAAGVPWTAEEIELLRTLRPSEVANRTHRTMTAVYAARRKFGLVRKTD
ncbi:hypothetical protein ETAA8_17960 [Anatilimnocola aggregata]|uniref:Uncharacterized protein n=1 Tax=Anatilimnocola aggregata TaxID=2528021 RepID=A0A517Y920_9BACT|nr:hypothetical protein [Anatilimnocola aggregata]QDU26715.1 hypothetical protein ETAA8_17960 [Anatilimnocola aggregata]